MSGAVLQMFPQPEHPFVRSDLDLAAPDAEVRSAARALYWRYGSSFGESMLWGDEHDKRLEELKKVYGEIPQFVNTYPRGSRVRDQVSPIRHFITNGDVEVDDNFEVTAKSERGRLALMNPYQQQQIQAVAFMDAMVQAGKVRSDDQIWDHLVAQAAEEVPRLERILARGDTGDMLVGTMSAAVVDPLVLATLPFGASAGVGRGALAALSRMAGAEAGLAFGSELAIQAQAYDFRNRVGYPMSFNEAAFNVLAATVGAGVLAPTIGGMGRLLSRYRKGVSEGTITSTRESEAAAAQVEAAMQARETVPPRGALDTHQERINEAQNSADHGELLEINPKDAIDEGIVDTPGVRGMDQNLSTASIDGIADSTGAEIRIMDPRDLIVDHELMQFKHSDIDAQGIRQSFKHVDEYSQDLAGVIDAIERLDGGVYVSDGAARVQIALRAIAKGQKNVSMIVRVMREADGVSVGYARFIAAMRNATSTTGSALDVAKVIRNSEFAGQVKGLSTRGLPQLRTGQMLADLEDEAFDMAVNEAIPANHAAIVGELIDGDAEQVATITALQRLKPANANQARSMVEDIRAAGFERQVTEDLFGERELAESLLKERAQVRDAAIKQAKADRTTFARLLAKRSDIESVGENIVDAEASAAKMSEAGEALAQLSKLSNAKGTVSDALTRGARAVKEGAKPAKAAEDVLRAIEGSEMDELGVVRPIEHLNGQRTSEIFAPGTDFEYTPSKGLSPYERAIENDLMDRIEKAAADDKAWDELTEFYHSRSIRPKTGDYRPVYDAMLEKGFSEAEVDRHVRKILSVDVAREISPYFIDNQTLAGAVHEPASAYIKRRLAQRFVEPKVAGEDRFLQMGGGTGSGKTSALRLHALDKLLESHVVLDGNAAKAKSTIAKYRAGMEHGLRPSYIYVFTNPVGSSLAAHDGAIVRAVGRSLRKAEKYGQDNGRVIKIPGHAGTHAGARNAADEIVATIGDDFDPRDVLIVDNSRTSDQMQPKPLRDIPALDEDKIAAEALDVVEDIYRNDSLLRKYPKIAKGFLDYPEGRERVPELFDGPAETAGEAVRPRGDTRIAGDGGRLPSRNADLELATGDAARGGAGVGRPTGTQPGSRAADELAEPFEPIAPDPAATFTRLNKAIQSTGAEGLDDVEELSRQAFRALEDNDIKVTVVDENGNEIDIPASEAFERLAAEERALEAVENCVRLNRGA